MPCKKDKGRMCGAGWRNSVFKIVRHEPEPYKPIANEHWEGCFVDKGNRDLPKLLREGYGNYKACFDAATKGGFEFVGLQYGGECWAGNSFGKYGKKPDHECSMPCKKDKGKTCGNGWRNSVFSLTPIEHGVDIDFTYEERMIIIVYFQWRLHMVTEEQYMSEVTRLGFTMESVNTVFQSKSHLLTKYDGQIKKLVIEFFTSYWTMIEGFTEEMFHYVIQIIGSEKSALGIGQTIEKKLVEKFNLDSSTYIFVQFHYYWSLSVFEGARTVFEVHQEDIQFQPADGPPEPEVAEIDVE